MVLDSGNIILTFLELLREQVSKLGLGGTLFRLQLGKGGASRGKAGGGGGGAKQE